MCGQSTAARTRAAIAERRASRPSAVGPRRDAGANEQRVAIRRVLEQPVDVARAHVAGTPAERAVGSRQGRDRPCPGDRRAVVDLVALELRARLAVGNAARVAWSCRPRSSVTSSSSPRPSASPPPSTPSRIAHAPAEHLQPAADAQHGHARRRPPCDRAGDAGGAQPVEVGEGALAAGDDDRCGRFDLGRASHVARVVAERGELVEIRDAGQCDDRDAAVACGTLECDAVLLGQRDVEPRDRPRAWARPSAPRARRARAPAARRRRGSG